MLHSNIYLQSEVVDLALSISYFSEFWLLHQDRVCTLLDIVTSNLSQIIGHKIHKYRLFGYVPTEAVDALSTAMGQCCISLGWSYKSRC